ncbi:DNA methyltransferase [Limosilactobacillus reuteri]|uniref:DNA methyltransferase n=1 Tax=Limosilactobacillus reuteri TaxID=1598 RepID=UPI002B056E11|nr:DNA methyltransferase [Limosilactobacillus reuteri]
MATRQQNAKEFVKTWSSPNKGREDADRQTFWNDLLQRVYGIDDYYNYITYEKDVPVKVDGKVTTRRIDGYIPSTKVLIEMKGKNVKDLAKPLKQSGGGGNLTPFEQAKRYSNFLPNSEQPRWILVSNFNEIDIHDMEHPLGDPRVIKLEDLPRNVKALEFMVDASQQQVINEKLLSVDAGNLVAKIYNELVIAYSKGRGIDIKDPQIQKSLNMLIVRLVFLLYADDSNLFGKEDIFQKFIEESRPKDLRQRLIELFKVLDQKEDEREPFLNPEYNQFPYVNGGMFSDEDVIIPQFTDELKRLIVEDAGQGFNWSGISPTIFGAVFESTLNPDTRRSGGMHYTSIENIHKVIDPLFLNDLHEEFDKIQNMGNRKQRMVRAREFRQKIGKLKFLDPACGSGNFLTETYLSLRKMENECLRIIVGDQGALAITDESDPQVKIQNFYGIEINDFAVSVARTAMWIAESQMWEQTKDITFANKDFLPLDSNDSIYEGNAVRLEWSNIVKPYELDYIMGNPPFVANSGRVSAKQSHSKAMLSKEQKEDKRKLFGHQGGVLDYVCCWYKKAVTYMKKTTIKAAFVSTDSIVQGQQVYPLWSNLFSDGIHINFAYRSFKWGNEASNEAVVFVVIIGFSYMNEADKFIFNHDGIEHVDNINAYLLDADDVLIKSRTKQISGMPKMISGGKPVEGGNLIFTDKQKEEFIKKEPQSARFFKRFTSGDGFIKNKMRWCLWLVDASPSEIRHMPLVKKQVEKVKKFRLDSTKKATQKAAQYPSTFVEIKQPSTDYLLIPLTTSRNRYYIPIGYVSKNIIANNGASFIPSASKYNFGVLTSKVHMAWMRVVSGYFGPSYRYSNTITYNNFPWPNIDKSQKDKVTKTAQAILDARKLYSDNSLADLYDPLTMPIELRKAHEANDKAVLKAYGLNLSATEPEIVQHLFKMYEQLVKNKE